jgi:hypothetical protein
VNVAWNLALVSFTAAEGLHLQANYLSRLFAILEQPVWELEVAIELVEVYSKAFDELEKSMTFIDP